MNNFFDEIEKRTKITDLSNSSVVKLVSSLDNIDDPVHSWYHLKEGYSKDFPSWLLNYLSEFYGANTKSAFDPFAGSGTSLVSLGNLGIQCDGIEYNPFIFWMASVKIHWDLINPELLLEAYNKILLKKNVLSRFDLPQLTTFLNESYFKRQYLHKIIDIREQIFALKYPDHIKNFLFLVLIEVMNDASKLKKDGRALRYIKNKNVKNPKFNFADKFRLFYNNLLIAQSKIDDYSRGDLINASAIVDNSIYSDNDKKYDLILFSPPYLNGFDYSEIYKLELWLLGFITSNDQWLKLRRNSFQSHWSVKFPEKNSYKKSNKENNIIEELGKYINDGSLNGSTRRVAKMVDGFIEDMDSLFNYLSTKIKSNGYLAYMVATSIYGNHHIKTDLLMSEIASKYGFMTEEIIVLKKRRSRVNGTFEIRDSVVILSKK